MPRRLPRRSRPAWPRRCRASDSLPRRTNHTHLALTGSLLLGGSTGVEAAGELRLMEAFGIGLGFTAGDGGSSEGDTMSDTMSDSGGSSVFIA